MNILLVDDHPLTNRGVASYLRETGRFSICAQVTTLADAKRHIENGDPCMPDLVILDIILGEDNGLDLLPFLDDFCDKNKLPKPLVLVCSVLEEAFRIQTAIRLGAAGYVSKAEGETALLAAIDAILRGEVYISERHSLKAMRDLGVFGKLSKRELEVLDMVKRNKTSGQIAEELFVSVRTVENHLSNIYFKTKTKDKLDLIRL